MKLLRATQENTLFDELEAQWKGQLANWENSEDIYLEPYRDHSKKVINGEYSNYFVYVLSHNGAHVGFMHLNWAAIKRLPGDTLRVVEICLSPDLDYQDLPKDKMALLCAGVFTELLRISTEELGSDNIKIHMGPLDRDYLSAFANVYAFSNTGLHITLQGSWMVIEKRAKRV
jgi:hypothetical protein